MTDREIIKALAKCSNSSNGCSGCPLFSSAWREDGKSIVKCQGELIRYALELIIRQKAEIERLKAEAQMADGYADALEERAKVEAIKELANRLNKEAEKVYIDREGDFVEADGEIYDTVADWCKKTSDNLVKEMVGDNE